MLFTIVFTLWLDTKVNKFLSILGALSCTPIAFTYPALFHYYCVAETKMEKYTDIAVIAISLLVLVYCTSLGFINWNS